MVDLKKETKINNDNLIPACFVPLYTLEDLVKSIQFYTSAPKPILALRDKSKRRLFVLGSKVHNVRLVFFFDLDPNDQSKYIYYKSADAISDEVVGLSSSIEKNSNNVQYITIVELSRNIFKEKKIPPILSVKIEDSNSLIKALIAKSIDADTLGKVYRLKENNKYFIVALSLLGSDDSNILYYSELKDLKAEDLKKGFIKYDYTNDIVEQTDKVGDTSFLYLRIVDLKEGFSFFKPE